MSAPENKRTAPAGPRNGSDQKKPSSFTNASYPDRAEAASVPAISFNSREKIEQLTDLVDLELDADRHFFERRPNRSYRFRRSYPVEGRVFALTAELTLPPGYALFVAVYQIEPGTRLRFPFTAPAAIETDLSEQDAKAAFAFVTRRADGPALLAAMRGKS